MRQPGGGTVEISADPGSTIDPAAPSSPSAPPTYLPLSAINSDQGQLWFAQLAADPGLLTGLLRETYGFAGTVVSDYFSVAFLHTLHGVAGTRGEAAALALRAGIDVELPTADCYGGPLLAALADGTVDMAVADRAVRRVLTQKCELGLLDPDWSPDPEAAAGPVTLDDSESRSLARDVARRSVVLLANQGTLPLAPGQRIAVAGPRSHEASAMLGCYSFPQHVGVHHPGLPLGIEVPTVLDALRADPAGYTVSFAEGCPVLGRDDAGLAAATAAASAADVCVAVLGDRSGLFGRGTSGEGCDAADLRLPGRQEELLEALLATGTPVVLVLLAGRPYGLSRQASRLAAAVCGFYPGEEGRGRAGRRPERAGQPVRPPAGQLPGRGLDPAGHLPRGPAGPAQPGQHHRSDPAVPLRPWAVLRPGHLGRGQIQLTAAVAGRRLLPVHGDAPQ